MAGIEQQIQSDMKDAMRARETEKLQTIRLIYAGFKQYKVDNQVDAISDEQGFTLLDKMAKQRRESIKQFRDNDRADLADKEAAELEIIQHYLPTPLTDEEIDGLIQAAIKETGAESMRDMGKLMGVLKPQMQGRCDMAEVSKKIKGALQ